MAGKFIVFEGVDGSGKSTQINLTSKWLVQSLGKTVLQTKEPYSDRIRELILSQPIGQTAELFLYAADRAEHVEKIIKPALDNDIYVLCDRFSYSSIAYQGYGRGINTELIHYLNYVCTNSITVDITLWLNIDIDTALKRVKKNPDRIEEEPREFFQRIHTAYATNPEMTSINANLDILNIQTQIQKALLPLC